MRLPTKIPTFIGLLFVLLMIGAVGWLFSGNNAIVSQASPEIAPKSVSFTNISDTAFTVIWFTPSSATGTITAFTSNLKKISGFDERDAATKKINKYTTHSVTLNNLLPSTSYQVTINSDGKNFTDQNGPYRITTGPSISGSSANFEPAFGEILDTANKPAVGAVVMLTPDNGQILSSLVKPSGSWLIPLNLARNEDLTTYLAQKDRINESILVTLGDSVASAITDTLNDAPVPTMVLGKSYDFRGQQANVPKINKTVAANSPQSGNSVLGVQTNIFKVSLTFPLNNAKINTNLPLVQGTGIPGKTVTITIGITKPFSSTTKVGPDGIWRYTPIHTLIPGKTSVTITSVNAQNKNVAITHLFEVLKSGTQVLGDATASATLTPAATPTTSLSVEPTLAIVPTEISTLAAEPMPISGTTLPTILLIIIGVGLFSAGLFSVIK